MPMDEDGQRGAVAGRLGGIVPVQQQHAAVVRREAEHDLPGDRRVVGDDRGDEAALAARGEGDGLDDAAGYCAALGGG